MKHLACVLFGGLYFLVLLACNEVEEGSSLRSTHEAFFILNNKEATRRLQTIMYGDTLAKTGKPAERFKIVHISDPHLSDFSINNEYTDPINLKQSVAFAGQPNLRINAMVATGDYITNGRKDMAMLFLQSFATHFRENNRIPSFCCTGNHDSNMQEEGVSEYISRHEINRILFNGKKQNYYYADVPNPQGGVVRFIALDMLDQPAAEYNTLYEVCYSQEQIDWLGNVALRVGMTDAHSVIVLTHYPFQPYAPGASTYLCDGNFVHGWSMVPEIIEAFRKRTSIAKVFPNRIFKGRDLTVQFDFSDSRGEFVCYLGGHDHFTATIRIAGFESGESALPPQLMLLCTNQSPSQVGTVYNRVPRDGNSESSNSFCIYALDTREKKIYITFFGAYKPDGNPSYPEIQTAAYL